VKALMGVCIVASLLAFAASAAGTSSPARLAYVAGTSVPKVYLAKADGTGARVLGTGESPLLAPDGRLVAAMPWGFAGPGVTLFTSTGAIRGRFFNAAKVTASPVAWSPDSRYVAVTVTGPGKNQGELVVIDARTNRRVVIAHRGIAGVSFAPNGPDRLAFGRSSTVDFKAPTNLFVANPDGSSLVQLTHDLSSASPVWGARGIAYNHAGGPHPATAINQLWLIQPDGTHATQITHFTSRRMQYGLTPLQFSAGGERLLATYSGGPTTQQTWAVDISTRHSRQLTAAGHPVTGWGISRDGQLALVEEQTNAPNDPIATIPFDGGIATIIAHGDSPSWNR
jgi:hypothetical protein